MSPKTKQKHFFYRALRRCRFRLSWQQWRWGMARTLQDSLHQNKFFRQIVWRKLLYWRIHYRWSLFQVESWTKKKRKQKHLEVLRQKGGMSMQLKCLVQGRNPMMLLLFPVRKLGAVVLVQGQINAFLTVSSLTKCTVYFQDLSGSFSLFKGRICEGLHDPTFNF